MDGCVAVCGTVLLTVWPVSRQSVVGVCGWVCCSVWDSAADCVACPGSQWWVCVDECVAVCGTVLLTVWPVVPAVSGGCVCMGVLQCV